MPIRKRTVAPCNSKKHYNSFSSNCTLQFKGAGLAPLADGTVISFGLRPRRTRRFVCWRCRRCNKTSRGDWCCTRDARAELWHDYSLQASSLTLFKVMVTSTAKILCFPSEQPNTCTKQDMHECTRCSYRYAARNRGRTHKRTHESMQTPPVVTTSSSGKPHIKIPWRISCEQRHENVPRKMPCG